MILIEAMSVIPDKLLEPDVRHPEYYGRDKQVIEGAFRYST